MGRITLSVDTFPGGGSYREEELELVDFRSRPVRVGFRVWYQVLWRGEGRAVVAVRTWGRHGNSSAFLAALWTAMSRDRRMRRFIELALDPRLVELADSARDFLLASELCSEDSLGYLESRLQLWKGSPLRARGRRHRDARRAICHQICLRTLLYAMAKLVKRAKLKVDVVEYTTYKLLAYPARKGRRRGSRRVDWLANLADRAHYVSLVLKGRYRIKVDPRGAEALFSCILARARDREKAARKVRELARRRLHETLRILRKLIRDRNKRKWREKPAESEESGQREWRLEPVRAVELLGRPPPN
ncbi:MAG: hypothetical protein DRN99_08545 [Thermoproteota archaeon]|nr:MAG: hypothetical protein DRN99_08545 [Candidatus Korarchaeota archaeon]